MKQYTCPFCKQKEMINMTKDEKHGTNSTSFSHKHPFYCWNCSMCASWEQIKEVLYK